MVMSSGVKDWEYHRFNQFLKEEQINSVKEGVGESNTKESKHTFLTAR